MVCLLPHGDREPWSEEIKNPRDIRNAEVPSDAMSLETEMTSSMVGDTASLMFSSCGGLMPSYYEGIKIRAKLSSISSRTLFVSI